MYGGVINLSENIGKKNEKPVCKADISDFWPVVSKMSTFVIEEAKSVPAPRHLEKEGEK